MGFLGDHRDIRYLRDYLGGCVSFSSVNWEKARKAALERDEGACQKCLRPAEHVHHRVLKGMGGTSDPEINFGLSNLVSLCASCHQDVHANPAKSYEEGWIVHSWQNPEDVEWESPDPLEF
jgi:5-methylcytosine-specific restriction endonuclease McrA